LINKVTQLFPLRADLLHFSLGRLTERTSSLGALLNGRVSACACWTLLLDVDIDIVVLLAELVPSFDSRVSGITN